jgi:hypothetical protein
VRGRSALLRNGWIRLGALLAILAGLVAYGVGSGGLSFFGAGSGTASAADCPPAGLPALAAVTRPRLLDQIHLFERIGAENGGTPYEWGPAEASSAWSDAEPGFTRLPPAATQPGGYAMRWWFPDRSDVSIDGFAFEDAGAAEEFLTLAADRTCRVEASAVDADLPPGGRNLSWVNPDGVAQEDALLRRGRRVYRVSAVLPGSGGSVTFRGRRAGFDLVDELACALPGAACVPEGGSPS